MPRHDRSTYKMSRKQRKRRARNRTSYLAKMENQKQCRRS